MKAYDVILDDETIDRVFWVNNSDADEVRRSLINHDGYDAGITVQYTDDSGKVLEEANENGFVTASEGL